MNKKPLKLTLVISLALAALVSQSAQADTKTWSSSDGSWDNDSNWFPFGVPGPGDDVIVSPYGGVDTILNFTSATGSRSANSLLINSVTANTINFLQTGGNLILSKLIFGYGTEEIESGGSGNYVLSGGSLSAENEIIGNHWGLLAGVNGVFTQTGGTNTVTRLSISLPGTGSRGVANITSVAVTCWQVTRSSGLATLKVLVTLAFLPSPVVYIR